MTIVGFGTLLRLTALASLSASIVLTGCGGNGSSGGTTAGTGGGSTTSTPLTITTVSPTNVPIGSPAITLVVKGTGFTASSIVSLNGTAEPTTYVSSTEVDASVTAGQLTTGQILFVTVANGSIAVTADPTTTALSVDNPLPSITGVSPAAVLLGSTAASIQVTGTNFVPGISLSVNGSTRATTYVSSTQLSAALTAADFATAQTLQFNVSNPKPGGGTSSASSIGVNNPVPSIVSLSPASLVVGSAATTLTLNGSGFLPTTVLQINGATRAATYVSSSQMTVGLTTTDLATVASLAITTQNPLPGGGLSAAAKFAVTAKSAATPVITTVSPTSFLVGSNSSNLYVYGTSLTSTSKVQWNGTALTTNLITSTSMYGTTTYLVAQVPGSLLATAGTVSITVNTPSASADSNALTVNVTNPPAPTLTSISPTAVPINTTTTLTLVGTGFTSASTVAMNGSNLSSTYVNATTLTATVPASSVALPGIESITVTTPAPGGGTSGPLYLTAYVAIPNNSMVYNSANGLFYLSVPSAVGAPYGNTIVSVDPATGQLGTPIPVGSEPNRMAITSDGKYLWVALDGAAAVRKVDLTTQTALYQFPIDLPGASTYTVAALAALPGTPDSVVVSTYYGGYTVPTGRTLAIFDGGVARPQTISFNTYAPFPWVLIVDGSTNEIYGPGTVNNQAGPYITYTYNANGITLKSSMNNLIVAQSNTDDVQIVGSTLYNSYGQALDAQTGAILGNFSAIGPVVVDPALGKTFILDGASGVFANSGSFSIGSATLRAFNTADYSQTASAPMPVALPLYRPSYQYAGPTGQRLTRWGSNGLAFRDTGGFVSLRSSLVQDISAVKADLATTVTAPATALTGNTTSYTVTVTNSGPSSATGVSVVSAIPSGAVPLTSNASAGSCVVGSPVVCDLGTIANGAAVQIVISVRMVSPGTATLTTQVSATENDPTSTNNSGSASVAVTGDTYNSVPVLSSVAPAGIVTGSLDTQITLTGTGFSAGSSVLMNGVAIQTSFSSPTQLTATVPASSLTSIGWSALSVQNPAPGGGASAGVPLYVFSALPLTANHVVYEPYSRRLLATIGTGTAQLSGNTLLTITPETGSYGAPVALAGTPTSLATSTDGQFAYVLLPSASSAQIARYNVLTQQMDFTAGNFQVTGYNVGLRDLATIPGSPNTLAVDEGEYPGTSIYDFDATHTAATRRGVATGIYSGTCLTAPDSSRLFMNDLYSSGSLLKLYPISSTGLGTTTYPYYNGAVLQQMNCMKADGNLLFGQAGGVASLAGTVPTQMGVFQGVPNVSNYAAGIKDFAPDASLGRAFYLTSVNANGYSAIFDAVTAFDTTTFMPAGSVSLPFSKVEGSTGFTGVDVTRWGQDGLAILSSSGTLYLMRGPIVVSQELSTNVAASLTASSVSTIAQGTANTTITLTGSNFIPGVSVTWNGSYRTTTIVDTTHVTVAIPASDLASAGTASLVATNPGASASGALTITVQ